MWEGFVGGWFVCLWCLVWNCGFFYFIVCWLISFVFYCLLVVCRFDRDLMVCWDSVFVVVVGIVLDGGVGVVKLGKFFS